MARFYGDIQGNRGQATRMGTAASGINAHPRGWNLGVKVSGYPSVGDSERDEFEVRVTGGSNGWGSFALATVRQNADGGIMLRLFTPGSYGRTFTEYLLTKDGELRDGELIESANTRP